MLCPFWGSWDSGGFSRDVCFDGGQNENALDPEPRDVHWKPGTARQRHLLCIFHICFYQNQMFNTTSFYLSLIFMFIKFKQGFGHFCSGWSCDPLLLQSASREIRSNKIKGSPAHFLWWVDAAAEARRRASRVTTKTPGQASPTLKEYQHWLFWGRLLMPGDFQTVTVHLSATALFLGSESCACDRAALSGWTQLGSNLLAA